MSSSTNAPPCPRCGAESDTQPADARIARCPGCAFIFSQTIPRNEVSVKTHLAEPVIAPDGILRGKYRLIRRLGEGAHGVSYLAEHQYLNHPCVVKILPRRAGDASDAAVLRLRAEARAGFRVTDPNVVRVLDCDVVRGTWYFVMEFIDGADLAAVVEERLRLPWHQVVEVGLDAAAGLAAIHRCGLLHRDLKPSNLLLGIDGRVRVADLGVAGLARDRAEAAASGTPEPVGTLAYAAPESFVGGAELTPASDLYSLGATLYHLATGRLPHQSDKVFQRLIDSQCRDVRWPSDAASDTPAWLVAVLLRLLAIEPEQRIESAERVVEWLRSASEPGRTPAAPAGPEVLEPRGLAVLPFDNERATPADDWIGYAIANSLSRALAELPSLYVADQDAMVAMLERLETNPRCDEPTRILTAARMVGAATIVLGRFDRDGDGIRVSCEVLRLGHTVPLRLPVTEGRLADLGGLDRRLLDGLVRALDIGGPGEREQRPGGRSPVVAAREKLVLARQAFLRGDYAEALGLAGEAIHLDAEFAEAFGLMGICNARMGNYDAAEEQHGRQEALAREWGDPRLLIEALANLGVMNYYRGRYEAAEEHYERAARTANEAGLAVEGAQIYNNLGFVLFRRERLANAERAFLRAIETHRAYGSLTSLVGPYNGMGNVLVEQGRYSEARTYYRRALGLAEEVGDRTTVGATHMHLGRCAALEQRFAEAKHELTMALNTLEETRFWNGLARAWEYSAEMNLQLGDYEEAIRCAERRIELARQHANVRMESAAWLQKAEALNKAGRVEEAAACVVRGRSVEGDIPASA